MRYVSVKKNGQSNLSCYNLTVDLEIFWVCITQNKSIFFSVSRIEEHRCLHAIFLTDLTAVFIVFPKYTDLVCIFNQCSNRVHLRPARRSCHPAFRSTCHAILSRGTNSPCRDLSDETRYSQFRPTIAGIEKQRSLILFFLISDRSLRLFTASSRLASIVQPFPLNSISFVSFYVLCYARSTCVWNKVVVKWIRNRRTICEKSTSCKQKYNFSKRREV